MKNVHVIFCFIVLFIAGLGYPTRSIGTELQPTGYAPGDDIRARYGGPMVLKAKIAGWGARMGIGEAFVGEKGLKMRGWTLTNIDLRDCLLIVGFKDHDIVIGTGTVKRDGGETVDLRVLDIKTTEEALNLLKSKDSVQRARGVWALGETGGKKAIPMLKEALGDEAWVVRRYALLSLNQQADIKQIVAIALESVGDKDGIVAVAGIRILQEKGTSDKRSLVKLLGCIEHKNWTVAKSAIIALGELGDESTLEPLRTALAKKPILTKSDLAEAIKKIEQRCK